MMDELMKGDEEVTRWVKKSKVIDSVERIPGDASSRRYYRVLSGGKSYIVMRMESFADQGMQLPFLVVQKHLALHGVDVPAVMDVDPGRGFVLLEDLGDTTLLRRLQDVSSQDVERHLYERAIDVLVQLQFETHPSRAKGQIEAYSLRFDQEKLVWEMNNTVEHFYEIHLKRIISPSDRKIMDRDFNLICRTLADEPTFFAHRDYHSRNLMIVPGSGERERFVMIDFQDARMGPAQYDLASLLRDSYYQLEETQIDRLLDYYIARREAAFGEHLDRGHFKKIFDLMSVQRNFKAIGSFASFLNRRNDATYLKYIGNTFENIRRNLLRYPEYSQLREVLFHYYYF
jgi:aminoglycoside/choline kinase family phosphotransferase